MKKRHLQSTRGKIFYNLKVYNKDNILIFRCDKRKFNWYLNRGLAERVSDDSIRLTFETKGNGAMHDDYMLAERKDICWICGVEENLTRHHILPNCYRKHMPRSVDNHDFCSMCADCHGKYEIYADKFKSEISEYYQAPLVGIIVEKLPQNKTKAISLAKAVKKYKNKIPPDKLIEIKKEIYEVYPDKSLEEILNICTKPKIITHGKLVINKCDDLNKFIFIWRMHFIQVMNPKFLPSDWDINRPFQFKEKRSS